MEAAFWNDRYGGENFIYGTAPNEFVAESAHLIPPGPVLGLGEGEGRNSVFLAERGYAVTAVDQSSAGLAKAARLAAARGVTLTTKIADLTDFMIEPGQWAGIFATFVHLLPPLRREVHRRAARGLRPGGVIVLEAYTPAQLQFRTGGPVSEPARFMQLDDLREDFDGLEFVVARELERDIVEGDGHRGRGAVVQIVARRPLDQPVP